MTGKALKVVKDDSETLVCTELEKAALREAVIRRNEAQQTIQDAVNDLNRRSANLEAIVNTVVKLRGLDPSQYSVSFDLGKDEWLLQRTPTKNLEEFIGANGKGPTPD